MRSVLIKILAPLVFVAACGDNPQGPAGANGMAGSTTLVSTSTEPAGANCASGGVRIDVGVDDNGDGILEPSEIDHTSYVCSGDASAHDSLVSVTAEPAGANCVDGGQRIDYGVDDNGNGVLDAAEVDGTSYVCNSPAGSDGRPNLLAVTSEPPGANCPSGGQRIDYGIDDNGNGVLDTAEIDGSTYVCNGANGQDGLRSLISVTAEPPGANCATGGQRVEYGIDDNGNGTLDASEVDGTTYVCNGADGTSPPQSLLSVTTEPAGANCPTGGQRIDHGLDIDGNGVLDAAEIDGTTFICNGANGLVAVTPETAGLNCATGGQRIDYGIDDNGNGTLDAAEIDGTTYVCNGADGTAGQTGLKSLLSVTPEPAGTNCATGGQRIDYGIDDNNNGTLDAAEIDGTAYACNGATGGSGLQSLVTTTPEAAGFTCPSGGQRIDYGIDDNSNGTLDAGEIDGTAYVCNAGSLAMIDNGAFATDLSGWTLANNAVGGYDTTHTFYRTTTGRLQNEASSGPSARVIYQDFTIPTGVVFAGFRMGFAQNNGTALDPQDVTVIQKDPYDAAGGGAQNAFRIDIVDPAGAQFYEPILYTLSAPTAATPTVGGTLTTVTDQTAALTTFFQAHAGQTLRLRIAQVESTFPWTVQLDDVTLVVGTN